MQHILAVSGKRVEDPGEDEDAREEQARPTKAGDYKKAFVASTAAQKLFKDKMDAYDREMQDTKDPKTIGKRTKIVQEWLESLSDDKKAEAGRVAEKYQRKNLPSMARDFIGTVHRTMGTHVMMFVAHEAGEGQVKMAVFETAPGDGKKAFTESSEPSKDWVLNGENILMDYLLASPVEEDSAEKQELEISLDEDGNPEVPTWAGQKLKVQAELGKISLPSCIWCVLIGMCMAGYLMEVWDIAKFTKKPKAKVPWGLLIKSPMEYLDSESIPEGFTMKDPSKWTKADLGLLGNHWQSQEAEEKVIVLTGKCPGSSKKKPWVDVEDDSEAEAGGGGVAGPSDQNMDLGEVQKRGLVLDVDVRDQTPEESSPAWHASKDKTQYLKSLSIMPRYQVLVDLVDGLPEVDVGTKVVLPHWATWALECQVFARGNAFGCQMFLGGTWTIAKFKGFEVVLGLGLLLRECSCAQEVEEDDPAVGHLHFLLNSVLGVQRGEDVMDIVGNQEGDGSARVGGSDGRDEEKEEEEAVDASTAAKKEESREWDGDKKTEDAGRKGAGRANPQLPMDIPHHFGLS
nr:hypothetical protein EDC04DRAFT_2601497 [Pisolithus marmoratus]